MEKRIRNKKGFTLAETLVAVAIVALAACAGTAVTVSVFNVRVHMTEAADASTLGSTLLQELANELRFGQNIAVSGHSVTLDSAVYGQDSTIKLDGGRVTAGDGPILADAAYGGLTVTSLDFIDSGDGSVRIYIALSGREGELWTGELSVTPLNGLK